MKKAIIENGKITNVILVNVDTDLSIYGSTVDVNDDMGIGIGDFYSEGIFTRDPDKIAAESVVRAAKIAKFKPIEDAKLAVTTLKGKALSPAGTLDEVKALMKEILKLIGA